eukprot:ctg_442.g136
MNGPVAFCLGSTEGSVLRRETGRRRNARRTMSGSAVSFLQRVFPRHSAASLARSVWSGERLKDLRSVARGSARTADGGGGWGVVSAARTRASLAERETPGGSDGIPDLGGASGDVGHETPAASPQSPAGATVAHTNGSDGASKKTLVVVESPAKARTIQKFLPPQYAVDACMGHVRDLPGAAEQIPPQYKSQPWARLGIHIEDDFRPLYVVPTAKKAVVDRLRQRLAECSGLILATDEDREGEAISWHLVELLQPQVPVRRAVFHEITEDAVREAFANCRDIDVNLVKAQEARRILDRLAGFTMSPLLWKKISRGLSAGRVQSVALAMIVEPVAGVPGAVATAECLSGRFGGAAYQHARCPAAVHHIHVAAGGEPSTAPLRRRGDAGSTTPLRKRPYHLHAHRLAGAVCASSAGNAPGGYRRFRRRPLGARGRSRLEKAQAVAGGARSHPPHRQVVCAARTERPDRHRAAPVRDGVLSHAGQRDGTGQGERHQFGGGGPRRTAAAGARSGDGVRRLAAALGVDTAAGGTEGGKGTRATGAGTADADAENGDGGATGILLVGGVGRGRVAPDATAIALHRGGA